MAQSRTLRSTVAALPVYAGPAHRWISDRPPERSRRSLVQGCVSRFSRPSSTSTESSVPLRSWRERILFAPGRVFFLVVLSLLELFGLPKIQQLRPKGGDGGDAPEWLR